MEIPNVLVVSRKIGERILIGDKIAITVVKVSGGAVRLGIEAPAELAVMGEELRLKSRKPKRLPSTIPRSFKSSRVPLLSDGYFFNASFSDFLAIRDDGFLTILGPTCRPPRTLIVPGESIESSGPYCLMHSFSRCNFTANASSPVARA